MLAGGDLNRIIHHARETRELSETIKGLSPQQRASLEESIRAVDPLSHAAALRDRARRGKVLMINAAEDEVIPRQCTEKLASALGIQDKVIWYEGLGHYSAMAVLPQALQTTADFFAEDLPEQVRMKPPAAAGRTPLGKVAALLSQLGTLLASEPSPEHCHFVDFDVSVTLKDGRRHDAHLRFVRGAKWRFGLHCDLPMLGKAALGQGAYPWMASAEKAVFKGTLAEDAEPDNPLAFADPQHLMRLRMLAGVLTAVAIAPDTLQRWVIVRDETASDGPPTVAVLRKDNPRDHLRIVFQSDAKTPRSLDFDVEGIRGTATFRVWQFGTVAHNALFDPPGDLPSQEVNPRDMVRMFSAMFNFAMENVQ
ncbi:MAG: hypothetical protein A2V70_06925 [Planctomycetes bacterium RBG_13_63_9]|nr:MAG: hypothetical protein A2V70_06925 [Planctomycetes bacterium RBG_13_63_9]